MRRAKSRHGGSGCGIDGAVMAEQNSQEAARILQLQAGELWHYRLGHRNMRDLCYMAKHELVKGLEKPKFTVTNYKRYCECSTCSCGKAHTFEVPADWGVQGRWQRGRLHRTHVGVVVRASPCCNCTCLRRSGSYAGGYLPGQENCTADITNRRCAC